MTRAGLACAALMLAACAAAETAPMMDTQPTEELARGSQSRQRAQSFELVTDPVRFEQLWRGHGGGARPDVDFAEHAVLALFLGEKPTGGYAVLVETVARDGDMLDVHVAVYEPGPGCMTTQALTQPFQFVRVPAGATDARFTTRRIADPCE